MNLFIFGIFKQSNLQRPIATATERSKFRLDTEESQWSAAISQNSFQPIDVLNTKIFAKNANAGELEIITAGPTAEENVMINAINSNI